MKNGFMARFLQWTMLCAVWSVPAFNGEQPDTEQQGPQAPNQDAIDDAVNKAPGLRMDPILFEVAGQFLDGLDVGEVFPVGAISSARDGYVVQEYRVLDANAAEAGSFYRIRTLVGEPTRDVAICFGDEGRIRDVYDLLTPEIDKEATVALKKDESDLAEADKAIPIVRFNSVPSGALLQLMIGLDTNAETMGLRALLHGVDKASELARGAGISEAERPKPAPDALVVQPVVPKAGTPAPTFAYKSLGGRELSTAAMTGKPFAVYVTSLKTLQGLASEKPLERRSAVMMSRISRWMHENLQTDFVKTRLMMVMTDPAEEITKVAKEGQGLLVSDPNARTAFDISVSPMLLIYGADGKLTSAYSCTSPGGEYLKALNALAK